MGLLLGNRGLSYFLSLYESTSSREKRVRGNSGTVVMTVANGRGKESWVMMMIVFKKEGCLQRSPFFAVIIIPGHHLPSLLMRPSPAHPPLPPLPIFFPPPLYHIGIGEWEW